MFEFDNRPTGFPRSRLLASNDSGQQFDCCLNFRILCSFSFDLPIVVHDRGVISSAEGATDLVIAGTCQLASQKNGDSAGGDDRLPARATLEFFLRHTEMP